MVFLKAGGSLSSGMVYHEVWSFFRVVFIRGGLSSVWSFLRGGGGYLSSGMVYHQVWSFFRVVFIRGCLSSVWSFLRGCLSSGMVYHELWSFFRVVFIRGGLSSVWSFLRGGVFLQEWSIIRFGLSSGWSSLGVVFHQYGLSSGGVFLQEWSVMRLGLSSGWSSSGVVFHQYGLSWGLFFFRNGLSLGFVCHPALKRGAAHASVENKELKRSHFKAWSRSLYNHTCHAYCQRFLPCLFLPSIHLHFFQKLYRFFLCWLWLTHGSCVGLQNKISHPAGCKFPC